MQSIASSVVVALRSAPTGKPRHLTPSSNCSCSMSSYPNPWSQRRQQNGNNSSSSEGRTPQIQDMLAHIPDCRRTPECAPCCHSAQCSHHARTHTDVTCSLYPCCICGDDHVRLIACKDMGACMTCAACSCSASTFVLPVALPSLGRDAAAARTVHLQIEVPEAYPDVRFLLQNVAAQFACTRSIGLPATYACSVVI